MDAERPEDDELTHAQDVFARTLRFLARCAEDPAAAVAAEDPRTLVRELKALSEAPPSLPAVAAAAEAEGAAEERAEPQALPLRRRRSA